MKTLRVIVCGMVVFFLFGCATEQTRVGLLNLNPDQSVVLTYPGNLRGTYVPRTDAPLKFCAEPAADVAFDAIQKLAATLQATLPSGASGQAQFSSDFSTQVVELAGRTQLVLLARELLYRACEYSLNNPDDKTRAFQMYKEVVDLVEALGKVEQTQADAKKTQAAANATQAEANKNQERSKLLNALHEAGVKSDQLLDKVFKDNK